MDFLTDESKVRLLLVSEGVYKQPTWLLRCEGLMISATSGNNNNKNAHPVLLLYLF